MTITFVHTPSAGIALHASKSRLGSLVIVERFPDLAALPKEEKRLLVSELCEDLAGLGESADPAIVRILEERWRQHQEDPSGAITLEEFRQRIGIS